MLEPPRGRPRPGRDRQRTSGRVSRRAPARRRPRARRSLRHGAVDRRRVRRRPARRAVPRRGRGRDRRAARRGSPPELVEPKAGISVTLHWRPVPEQADAHRRGRRARSAPGTASPSCARGWRSSCGRRSTIDKGDADARARRPASTSPRSRATTPATSRRSPRSRAAVADGRLRRAVRIGVTSTRGAAELADAVDVIVDGPAGLRRATRPRGRRDRRASRRVSASVASARSSWRARRRSSSGIDERVVERARALFDVVRVHGDRGRLQLVVRAGLGREAQHAVAAVARPGLPWRRGSARRATGSRAARRSAAGRRPSGRSRRGRRARSAPSRASPSGR